MHYSKKLILSFYFLTAPLHAFDTQMLIDHVKKSIQNALSLKSTLSQGVEEILPGIGADRENWWNGLYVGALQK